MMARECEFCGGPIPERRRADAMYCSKKCNVASSNAAIAAARLEAKAGRWCEWCGGPIPISANIGAIFCCVPCQRRGIYHRKKAERVRVCVACGVRYEASTEVQKTCSWKCANNQREPDPRPCQGCGCQIEHPRRDQLYCGVSCRQRASRQRRKARS